jgi:hypothetical protein
MITMRDSPGSFRIRVRDGPQGNSRNPASSPAIVNTSAPPSNTTKNTYL